MYVVIQLKKLLWFTLIMFFLQNARQASELVDILKEANQQITPELYDMSEMARNMQMEKG